MSTCPHCNRPLPPKAPITIDEFGGLWFSGARVSHLTVRQAQILEVFLKRFERLVPLYMISSDEQSARVWTHQLRSKLPPEFEIVSEWGRGYVLRQKVMEVA